MANIQYGQKRKNNTRPIYIKQRYTDADGKRRQKLIPCKNEEEAKTLLPMVGDAESNNREFIKPAVYPKSYNTGTHMPGKMTVRELLELYSAFALANGDWKPSGLDDKRRLIQDQINPYIGDELVAAINTRYMQNFFDDVPNHPESPGNHKTQKNNSKNKPYQLKKVLGKAFDYAVTLEEITTSPITKAIRLPRYESAERPHWTRLEFIELLSHCDDPDLKAMIAVMAGCTLRTAELSGLMWDCVHIPEKPSPENPAYVEIKRELTRYNPHDMEQTGYKAYLMLPCRTKEETKKRLVVMESLKTRNSVRKIFIGEYLTDMLTTYKNQQNIIKEKGGSQYHDFGFVFANKDGFPYTSDVISKRLHKYAKTIDLSEEITFYSLRATGTTIKAKIAPMHIVEADTGHAPRGTTRKYYVHAEEEDRIKLAYDMDTAVFDDVRKAEAERQNLAVLDDIKT